MIQKAWTWLSSRFEPQSDPVIEQRVRWYAKQVAAKIGAQRDRFDLKQALANLDAEPALAGAIADRTYRLFLRRAWADGRITAQEREKLAWLGGLLGITPRRAREINHYTADVVFRRLMTDALADRVLDDSEVEQLRAVADSQETDLASLARAHFARDGRVFIDMIAEGVQADGMITDGQWQAVLDIASKLGLSEADVHTALQPHAKGFVADVLDRIAADSVIDGAEMACIESLLSRLRLGSALREQIKRATTRLEPVRSLENPSIGELATTLNRCAEGEALSLTVSQPTAFRETDWEEMRQAKWWQVTAARGGESNATVGAARSAGRTTLSLLRGSPRRLRTDAPVVGFAGQFGSIFFLPIGALLLRRGEFTGVPYAGFTCDTVRSIETATLANDAEVVEHTWRYLDKSGEPDQRFQNNDRLPVCEYGQLVSSQPALELKMSNNRIPQKIARAARGI